MLCRRSRYRILILARTRGEVLLVTLLHPLRPQYHQPSPHPSPLHSAATISPHMGQVSLSAKTCSRFPFSLTPLFIIYQTYYHDYVDTILWTWMMISPTSSYLMGDGGVVYIVLLPPWALMGICGPPMVGMSFYWMLWPTVNSLMMVMLMTMANI